MFVAALAVAISPQDVKYAKHATLCLRETSVYLL